MPGTARGGAGTKSAKCIRQNYQQHPGLGLLKGLKREGVLALEPPQPDLQGRMYSRRQSLAPEYVLYVLRYKYTYGTYGKTNF